jgi:hypothetical protein
MIAALTQQETTMINLFKNRDPKTSNTQTSELSSDDLASVTGGTKTPPPSGSSEGCGFTRLPGHPDPRAF